MSKEFSTKILSDNELEKIHQSSLQVLEEIGVGLPHKEVLDIFKQNKFDVDFENKIVKMPKKSVEDIIKRVIQNTSGYYEKYGDLDFERHNIDSIMAIANLDYFIDFETKKKRKATIQDILKSIVVGNALGFKRVSCFVKPNGYDDDSVSIIQHYLLYLHSENRLFKNQMHHSLNCSKCIIEMAKVVAENEIQLKNGSLVEFEFEPVANLEFTEKDLEVALEFSKNKMKVLTTHWCWMGYHTPPTYAGTLTLSNANFWAGVVVLMLLNPETLFFDYIFATHCMNKNNREMPLFGGPNQAVLALAGKQLADFYGFKYCLASTGITDSIDDNYQSGFEKGVNAALAFTAGVDNVGVRGIIGPDQGVSLEQLIIDSEMDSYYDFIFNCRITVDDKTIDIEFMKKNGIGKNFLDSPEHDKIFDENYWDSDIFFRGLYKDYSRNAANKKIKDKLNSILKENYPPEPVISRDKVLKLDEIIKKYMEKSNYDRFKKELKKVEKSY